MNGQLSMFAEATLPDSPSATSSPASVDGVLRSGWLAGRTKGQSGQEAAPASHTASLASLVRERKGKAMSAIFGRTSSASSESNALAQSLANRLQAQLLGDGGTRQHWIWKAKATPARRLYCVLMRSERPTKGNASTGLPTPAARDGKDLSSTTAYLAARSRHSPSLATLLLARGLSWRAIPGAYALTMGYPLEWEEAASTDTATQLSRKSQQLSSRRCHD